MTKIFELINFGGKSYISSAFKEICRKNSPTVSIKHTHTHTHTHRKEFSFAQDIFGVKNGKEIWVLLMLSWTKFTKTWSLKNYSLSPTFFGVKRCVFHSLGEVQACSH